MLSSKHPKILLGSFLNTLFHLMYGLSMPSGVLQGINFPHFYCICQHRAQMECKNNLRAVDNILAWTVLQNICSKQAQL